MKNSRKIVDIVFYVGDYLYSAPVFLNKPTAIVIPDQNVLVYTNLGPRPDSSSTKNRHHKIIDPTDEEQVKIDLTRSKTRQRTIFDSTGRLNELKEVRYPEEKPFRCNCTMLVVATREYSSPY